VPCRCLLTSSVASAPGRVNLIGEHTDYNGGFVLPIATPQQTTVHVSRRDDQHVRVCSANVPPDEECAEFRLGEERRGGKWIDYVQGVTVALREAGCVLNGFDGRVESGIPLGAGLASSASFEVALIRALTQAFHLDLDALRAARIGHRAETAFVGVPVGIMDQMAASLATVDTALFLDTRSLEFERVPLPASAELIVIDSGIKHHHAAGEYRTRRAECDEAARLLGVEALRDVPVERLSTIVLAPPLDRRVRHVVTENARVLHMREALRSDDATRAGTLMNASHDSMRDDFEVSIPEIDALVDAARSQPDAFGARLTGGGFGGCIVVLAMRGKTAVIADAVLRSYARLTGRSARVLIP
jgi:galactokinase